MRDRADWMTPADDQILELVAQEGSGTPMAIANEIGKDNNYVGVRCRTLESYGLLERPTRGYYKITDDGRAYLEGDLDANTLEKLDDF